MRVRAPVKLTTNKPALLELPFRIHVGFWTVNSDRRLRLPPPQSPRRKETSLMCLSLIKFMTSFCFSGSFASASVKKNTQDPGFAIFSAFKRTKFKSVSQKSSLGNFKMMIKHLNNEYLYDSANQTDTYISKIFMMTRTESYRLLSQWGPFLGSLRLHVPSCCAAISSSRVHQLYYRWKYLLYNYSYVVLQATVSQKHYS